MVHLPAHTTFSFIAFKLLQSTIFVKPCVDALEDVDECDFFHVDDHYDDDTLWEEVDTIF